MVKLGSSPGGPRPDRIARIPGASDGRAGATVRSDDTERQSVLTADGDHCRDRGASAAYKNCADTVADARHQARKRRVRSSRAS